MLRRRFKVYVTRADMPERSVELIKEQCHVKKWKKASPVPRTELLKSVAGVDAIYCSLNDKIDQEVLDAAGSQLKVIQTFSDRFDHIDLEECRERGIRIGYTPDEILNVAAGLTVSVLLSATRKEFDLETGGFVSWASGNMAGPELEGATVGIVGFGRIGQAVARRIKSFNTAKILYYSRSERPEGEEIGAVKVGFNYLLKQSDFVIACASLVPETKGLFNKGVFERMKRSAVYVNTTRSALVDQDALFYALKNGYIWGAGLSPKRLSLDNPLIKLKNCYILPPCDRLAICTIIKINELTAQNILTALKGEEMPAELQLL